jgi:hypothetical protein
MDEDFPTREELETWEKSDLIDFILGEDTEEEDSEDSVIPVDVTLPCTQTSKSPLIFYKQIRQHKAAIRL